MCNILLSLHPHPSLHLGVGGCVCSYIPTFFPLDHWKVSSDIKILQYASPKNKSCLLQNFQTIKVVLMSCVSPRTQALCYSVGYILVFSEASASVGPRCQAVASGCSQGRGTGPAFYVSLGLVLNLIQKSDTQGLGFPGTNNLPILLFCVLNVLLIREYIHTL